MATINQPIYGEDLVNKAYVDSLLEDTIPEIINNTTSKNFGAEPQPPYHINDTWTDGSNLYVCVVERLIGDYNSDDWTLATAYTDNSALTTFIDTDYAQFVDAVDGTMLFHYQSTDPELMWDTYTKKELHVGDLWKNSSTQISYQYTKTEGTPPTYSWVLVDTSDTLFDMIDGKKTIFSSIPSMYHTDDLLIIPFGAEDLPEEFSVGDIVISASNSTTFSWSDWRRFDNYTRYTDFTDFKSIIEGNITNNIEPTLKTFVSFKSTWENNLTEMRGLYDKTVSSFDENGLVKEVKTTTGFVFDYEGLNISREGEPLKLLLGYVPTEDKQDTEVGLRVSRISDDTTILRATETGVTAENVTVNTYLTVGENTRIEDYDGGIGFFYIGS